MKSSDFICEKGKYSVQTWCWEWFNKSDYFPRTTLNAIATRKHKLSNQLNISVLLLSIFKKKILFAIIFALLLLSSIGKRGVALLCKFFLPEFHIRLFWNAKITEHKKVICCLIFISSHIPYIMKEKWVRKYELVYFLNIFIFCLVVLRLVQFIKEFMVDTYCIFCIYNSFSCHFHNKTHVPFVICYRFSKHI